MSIFKFSRVIDGVKNTGVGMFMKSFVELVLISAQSLMKKIYIYIFQRKLLLTKLKVYRLTIV